MVLRATIDEMESGGNMTLVVKPVGLALPAVPWQTVTLEGG